MLRKFAGQPLTTWPTGREATTSNDIAERDALREGHLTPEATTISEYQIKLTEQESGASVLKQRTIPVVLYPGNSEAENDNTFTRWSYRARRLPSMNALRASASKADVRLERKLRYEFAKLKAKGQLRSLYRTQYAKPVVGQTTTVSTVQAVAGHSVLVSEPCTPTPIGGKRVGMQVDPQRDAQ